MRPIDGYTDLELIGQGGLGDVYRARRSSTGATVAIKLLRDVADASATWNRTRRELAALVELAGHAHVVHVLEVLELDDGPALVMEHAPGGSIAELMRRRGEPLSVGETALVGRQVAAALAAAHARGIVHRDVKPQNVLIDAYGQLKLCDFGIAALSRSEEFRHRTSSISQRYASPEDLDGELDVGPPSDVYSLGATLLHMSRGAPPTLKDRLISWRAPVGGPTGQVALDRVIASCLQVEPARRPSATDVADQLQQLSWSIDERNRDARPPVDTRTAAIEAGSAPPDHTARPDPSDRPSAGERSRGFASAPMALVALASLVFAVGAGWLFATTRSATPGEAVAIVSRPTGLVPLGELSWPTGPVGECLVQLNRELVTADCTTPHDLQRYSAGLLDEASRTSASARAHAGAACDAAIVPLGDVADREVVVSVTLPSPGSWHDGDRRFECYVAAPDRRLIGDVLAFRAR